MKSKYHMTSIDVAEESELNKRYTRIKRSKENESGRSMVEMLGVLALMGVLAIAGVMGYRWAMDKYRATDTINEVNRRAIVHSTQLMSSGVLNASEFPLETRQGYGTEATLLTGNQTGYFEISLTDVPGGVCREILKSDWVWPVMKKANGIDYTGNADICRTDTGVRMVFVFSSDLSGKSADFRQRCQKDDDCRSACGVCDNGYCSSQCREGETCGRTYDNSEFYACCSNDKVLNGVCCPTIMNGQCCASIGSCCPADKPLMDKDGNCHTCDEEGSVNVTGNTVMCGICDGQDGRTKRELNGNTCVLPCPPETPLMDRDGNCHRCDEDSIQITVANKSKCDVCPDRNYWGPGARCELPCGINSFLGTYSNLPCNPCTTTDAINITYRSAEECITKCDGSSPDRPKRIDISAGAGLATHFCALASCPKDKPIRSSSGTCYACGVRTVNVTGFEQTCFSCPGYVLRGKICTNTGCPTGSQANEEGRCVCDDSTQVQDSSGNCYPCDSGTIIDVTGVSENCDVCQGRRVTKVFYPSVTKCMKPCADDEFYTGEGCRKCNDTAVISMYDDAEYCLYCDGQEGRAQRVCVPGACHACALVCSSGMTMAGDGTCHTCDEVEPFSVSNGMTASCNTFCAGKRYLVGTMCYKCPPDTYSPDAKQCIQCPYNNMETLTREADCQACGGSWDGTTCQ